LAVKTENKEKNGELEDQTQGKKEGKKEGGKKNLVLGGGMVCTPLLQSPADSTTA